jgi:hypothetical protein
MGIGNVSDYHENSEYSDMLVNPIPRKPGFPRKTRHGG